MRVGGPLQECVYALWHHPIGHCHTRVWWGLSTWGTGIAFEVQKMKVTVVDDNEVKKEGLRRGYGFSCFVEAENMPSVLLDAGGDSPTLLHNMRELNIEPRDIGIIVITHAYGD